MTAEEHRRTGNLKAGCAVVTVGDSRNEGNDTSGRLISEMLSSAGHSVVLRRIVRDEPEEIRHALYDAVGKDAQVAILTGGTGMTGRDVTYETVYPLLRKRLDGFGEIFRLLSYQEIGAAAMLSRAFCGVYGRMIVFCLPGSPDGVRLAMDRLILPELGHMLREVSR